MEYCIDHTAGIALEILQYRQASNNGDKIGGGLTTGSMMLGIGAYHVGSHMQGVSRFRPIITLDGKVRAPATSRYRFGPMTGNYASKLGAGLRIGGGLLGGAGMFYTGFNMYTGKTSLDQGMIDLGMGAISFLGLPGMAVTGVYYSLDLFLKYGESMDLINEINSNTYNGVWFGGHNHFK